MTAALAELAPLSDNEIVRRVVDGDTGAYEALMRRYNQRLYRAARAILRDDDEAEDVLQETYVRAYQHLKQFAGEAQFSTWLTRIAVNECLSRLRRRKRVADLKPQPNEEAPTMDSLKSPNAGPDEQLLQSETRHVLESAIDALPKSYRTVFLLREVEGMSTAETAVSLDLSEETVKIRLHRSRRMLRRGLYDRAGAVSAEAFRFMGERCDRVVQGVLRRLSVQ
jgi:RNA polymerase sigma-70 factor (ECF subfamily)